MNLSSQNGTYHDPRAKIQSQQIIRRRTLGLCLITTKKDSERLYDRWSLWFWMICANLRYHMPQQTIFHMGRLEIPTTHLDRPIDFGLAQEHWIWNSQMTSEFTRASSQLLTKPSPLSKFAACWYIVASLSLPPPLNICPPAKFKLTAYTSAVFRIFCTH